MTFDFIGQERWQNYFHEAVKKRRLGHAYLFYGPEHVGKATFVNALARSILCFNATREGDACGSCPSCRAWSGERHPDCRVLASDHGHISVEAVREFISDIGRSPSLSKLHLGLIFGLDQMTLAAHNAFLKTLEEPTSKVVLLMTAPDLSNLPLTVRSRIEHCLFAPVASPVLTAALVKRGIDRATAREVSDLARGCPGQALSWLEQSDRLASFRSEAIDFIRVLQADMADRLNFTEKMATEERCSKSELERIIDHWLIVLRDGLLFSLNLPEFISHEILRSEFASSNRPSSWWRMNIDSLLGARHDLKAAANRRLALNNFFINA